MKKQVELGQAKWIVEPGCVVLVTSGTMERPNVMTFSWQSPVNTAEPCQVLLVISKLRYSYELIKRNRQLVINVPGDDLLEQTHYVGIVSGRGVDKFKESGLTPVPAGLVEPPLIEECPGHLECRVTEIFEMSSHDLLICDVVRALADEDLFEGRWVPERFHTLHYLRGDRYGLLTRTVRAKAKPAAASGPEPRR